MLILSFVIQLFGATFLLLFAVRMVRTGIERAYGASFLRVVTSGRGTLRLVPLGALLAMVLQSSAAVTLLAAGFAGAGALAFGPGMAIVLGGDLGSSLLILVLTQQLDWLVPILLTLGGFLFLKTEARSLKQAGRIILGVAFILIALQFLRATVEPIRESDFLPAVSAYLERDYLTAFIVGGVLAFVMHSSVAVILMCVTIVGMGALPTGVGISLVLGANLGSATIPMWLTRGMSVQARRIPLANLLVRGTAALAVLFALNATPLGLPDLGLGPGMTLVAFHIGFNALVVLTLPLATRLGPAMERLLPSAPAAPTEAAPHLRSALDPAALSSPRQSLACLRREVLRMADVLRTMIEPVMGLYDQFDKSLMQRIESDDHIINRALDEVRRYTAAMPRDDMTREQQKDLRALIDYAIALEAAGDIVVKRLLPLAAEKHRKGRRFSEEGRGELVGIHEQVTANLTTATNALVTGDVESARLLLEEKAEMGRLERASRKKHLRRLTAGDTDSFGSSDIHLETAYCLKEFNSWIVTVAHPILIREGQLLETRLIRDMDDEEKDGTTDSSERSGST